LGGIDSHPELVVPALAEMLKDEEWYVRSSAGYALAQFGADAEAAGAALMSAMDDDVLTVRFWAADALSRIETQEVETVVLSLVDLLEHEDANVIRGAAVAIGKFGPRAKAAVSALTAALGRPGGPHLPHIIAALGTLGPAARDAVPAIADLLSDPAADVRVAAAQALGAIGPDAHPAVPALVNVLRYSDAEVRMRPAIVEALSLIGPKAREAIPTLMEIIHNEGELMCHMAVDALKKIDPTVATAVELQMVNDH
jgi:HEAT repeat protein